MEDVKLYTVKETAGILKTNPNYVYDLIRHGLLPAIKLGSYKIRRESLYKFLSDFENSDLTNLDDIKTIDTLQFAQ